MHEAGNNVFDAARPRMGARCRVASTSWISPRVAGAVVALALMLLSTSALAGTFDQLNIYGLAGKSEANWHGQADLLSLNFELTHTLSPHFEAGVVVAPTSVWQSSSWFGDQYGDGNERAFALMALAVGRFRLFPESERMDAYAEIAGGPMWADIQVPAATSRFNFTTQLGAGLILSPRSRTSFVVGWRYLHISNGGYSPRNPGLNVHSLTLGVRLRIATPHPR